MSCTAWTTLQRTLMWPGDKTGLVLSITKGYYTLCACFSVFMFFFGNTTKLKKTRKQEKIDFQHEKNKLKMQQQYQSFRVWYGWLPAHITLVMGVAIFLINIENINKKILASLRAYTCTSLTTKDLKPKPVPKPVLPPQIPIRLTITHHTRKD